MELEAWTHLVEGNRDFIFNNELVVKITHDDEIGWVFESEELGLRGYGLERQEAHLEFCQDFSTSWDCLACEDDSDLTLDAIDSKRFLRALVRKVISVQ
jgi:hypothetical protein